MPVWLRRGWVGPVGVAGMAAAQVLDARLPLRWVRAEFLEGAWWQPFTAQWVHLDGLHAFFNAAALLLMLGALAPWLHARVLALAGLGGVLGVASVLLLDGQCAQYAGASGALHGLWAGAAWALWRRPGPLPQARWLGALMLAAVVVKLMVQRLADAASVGWLGAWPVYLPAHEAGALGGLLWVGLGARWQALRAAQRH